MKLELAKGYVEISNEVLTLICGDAAARCLWVGGMVPATTADSIADILGIDKLKRGIKVTEKEDGIDVELHIRVKHGMNISAASRSIIEEVRYVVEDATGVKVGNVNVCVDGIIND